MGRSASLITFFPGTHMPSEIPPPPVQSLGEPDRLVGITTTIPAEVIYAAGLVPVDLNNLFVTHDNSYGLVATAEKAGFPRTCCCWTKGLYGAVHAFGIEQVIGVVRGDCSNTHELMEVLEYEGIRCMPFDYPREPDEPQMQAALTDLAARMGTDLERAEAERLRLRNVRRRVARIDELTWRERKVSGNENHLWLLNSSDYCGDPDHYSEAAEEFIERASAREPADPEVSLGYVGVPPIADGLYRHVEKHGGLVTYNETQREFSMPFDVSSLAEQYSLYTYPYGMLRRIEHVRTECELRDLDGIIHYVQSFCSRRIGDPILRDALDVPVLTIECDTPGPLSGQLQTRLEAFVQMLVARKHGRRLI